SIPINNTYTEAAKASTEVDTAADAKAAGDTNITNIEYVQNNNATLSLVLSLKAYNFSLNEKRSPEVIRGFVLSKI
ncbi:MAG: hypothetical protein ACFNLZ_04855, partial [Haemophilus parainfluenzae]